MYLHILIPKMDFQILSGSGEINGFEDSIVDIKNLVKTIRVSEQITKIDRNVLNDFNNAEDLILFNKECEISIEDLENNNNITIYCETNSNMIENLESNQIKYFTYNSHDKYGDNVEGLYNSTEKKLVLTGIGDTYDFKTTELPWKNNNNETVCLL